MKVSPLAVRMVTGGVSFMSRKSELLPDKWLDAAESMSQVWFCGFCVIAIDMCSVIGGMMVLAIMIKPFVSSARWAGGPVVGLLAGGLGYWGGGG